MSPSALDQTCWEHGNVFADLVHSLSQPLTALHGSLTASLRQPPPSLLARQNLQVALQQADTAIFLAAAMRELLACEDGLVPLRASDLNACLTDVVEELLPVAQSARLAIKRTPAGLCQVRLETGRLRQALHYVVEFAIHHARPQSEIRIRLTRKPSDASITVRVAVPAEPQSAVLRPGKASTNDLHRRVTLAIARRTFELAAGSLEIRRAAGQTTLLIRLPRFHQEPALPLAAASRCCG